MLGANYYKFYYFYLCLGKNVSIGMKEVETKKCFKNVFKI